MKTKVCSVEITPISGRKMSFIISNASVDRDGDSIDPNGWDLENYKRSPVVLWAHDTSQPPVAKTTAIWSDYAGLHAQVEFPPQGLYPFADMIHNMVKDGFLNATSVGFLVKEATPNKTGGHTISRAELLEFSIVSVPSNPSALVMSRGLNKTAVQKWFGDDAGMIDWDSINASASEIDLDALSSQLSSSVELNVSRQDVIDVIHNLLPAMKASLLAGFQAQAALAVREKVLFMTGRID